MFILVYLPKIHFHFTTDQYMGNQKFSDIRIIIVKERLNKSSFYLVKFQKSIQQLIVTKNINGNQINHFVLLIEKFL